MPEDTRPQPPIPSAGASSAAWLEALAALAQQTRFDTFCLLAAHQPDGLRAGELSTTLNIVPNTLSFHLATLQRADLVTAERQGRHIQYRARPEAVRELGLFLLSLTEAAQTGSRNASE